MDWNKKHPPAASPFPIQTQPTGIKKRPFIKKGRLKHKKRQV
ncbi:hypothetical protein HMPREF3156_01924 [Neisseria sp. HMSC06F02]|nr:hypothetical protein HMPREF3156_01924 [Neisseria sp. HMSC06F02]